MEFEEIEVGKGSITLEKRGVVCEVPKDGVNLLEMSFEEFIKKEIEERFDEIKEAKIFRLSNWVGVEGESYGEDEIPYIEKIIEYIIENKEIFDGVEEFQIGLMSNEVEELSDIWQGDYSEFLKTFKNIKKLVIGGSLEIILGEGITHENMEELVFIPGEAGNTVMEEVMNNSFPSLKGITIYSGVTVEGDDCIDETVVEFLESEDIRKVEKLGLLYGYNQDKIVELLFKDGYIDGFENLKKLDFNGSGIFEEGAEILLKNKERVLKIEEIDLGTHGIEDEETLKKLEKTFPNIKVGRELGYEEEELIFYSQIYCE